MQREVKFRGWGLYRGWELDRGVQEMKMFLYPLWSTLHDKYVLYFCERNDSYVDESDNDTDIILMQSTGCDDKNGKEIYESDLIQVDGIIAEVIFRDGCFCALPISVDKKKWITEDQDFQDISFCHLKLNEWEVIGNIYENPELLSNT